MTSDAAQTQAAHDHADHADHGTHAAGHTGTSMPLSDRRVTLTIPTGPLTGAARVRNVEDALKAIPGVTRVHMHPKDHYAHVTVREGTSERDLRAVALAAGASEAGQSYPTG